MFTVTKSFNVPIGHRLMENANRCFCLHGHNLKIDVEVSRESLNKNGMVIDFYDLKKIVESCTDAFDHSTILNSKDKEIGDLLSQMGGIRPQRVRYLPDDMDPTSENLCYIIYNVLSSEFTVYDEKLKLKSISIWESDTSKAKYEP